MRTAKLCFILLFTLVPATTSFAAGEPPVTLTIYNDNFAMIQEVRGLRLARGTQEYRVSDVTDQIEPTSVRIPVPDRAGYGHPPRTTLRVRSRGHRPPPRAIPRPARGRHHRGGRHLQRNPAQRTLRGRDPPTRGRLGPGDQEPNDHDPPVSRPARGADYEAHPGLAPRINEVDEAQCADQLPHEGHPVAGGVHRKHPRKRRASSSLADGPPSKTVRATPSRTPGSGSWPATYTGSLRKPIEPKTACEGKRP